MRALNRRPEQIARPDDSRTRVAGLGVDPPSRESHLGRAGSPVPSAEQPQAGLGQSLLVFLHPARASCIPSETEPSSRHVSWLS